VTVVGCDDALAQEAQRIAAIELRAALVAPTPGEGAATQITASCHAALADLRVVDTLTGKALERPVALGQAAPSARARLLALAIAELVAASWSDRESNPQPKAPPPTPRAPVTEPEPKSRAVAPWQLELVVLADMHLLASRDLIPGGGGRAEIWVGPAFFWRFDALAHYAELSRGTGAIALTMASVSSAFGASFGAGSLRPGVSLGARVGYVWMSGAAASAATRASDEQGVWLGPELAVELAAWPHARIHPVLSLSAGAHIFGVKGTVNEGRDVKATALWSALSLGIAVR
jgi:hypothetical protein